MAVCLMAAPVAAEDLPYPPDYFSEFRTWYSVAIVVAGSCPELMINRTARDRLLDAQLTRLEKDGFSREKWPEQMREVPPIIAQKPNTDFFLKWGVRKDDVASHCRAGRAEIAAGSLLGQLLMEGG